MNLEFQCEQLDYSVLVLCYHFVGHVPTAIISTHFHYMQYAIQLHVL